MRTIRESAARDADIGLSLANNPVTDSVLGLASTSRGLGASTVGSLIVTYCFSTCIHVFVIMPSYGGTMYNRVFSL